MHVNGAVRAASARVLGVDYSLCRFAFNPLLSTGDFTEILEKGFGKKVWVTRIWQRCLPVAGICLKPHLSHRD